MEITTPEAMLRFRCNEKGCCCAGWNIPFTVAETARVTRDLPEDFRRGLLAGAKPVRDPRDPGRVVGLALPRVPPDGRCVFLADDKRCEIHATQGPEALPALCQSFPGFAFDEPVGDGARRILTWDPICPEVLERLDEDGAYAIVTVEPEPGTALAGRARSAQALPPLVLAGQTLAPESRATIEHQVRGLFDDPDAAAIDQLARVNVAMARALAAGDPTSFAPEAVDDAAIAGFDAFFDACVEAHSARAIALQLIAYRRFVHALDLDDGALAALEGHLDYDPRWRERLDPRAAALQPLLRRYLAHRFFSAFERSPATGDVAFNYGSVNHTLATALRLAIGLGASLDREVDRSVLKVSIGASEAMYRALALPAEAMPWFGHA